MDAPKAGALGAVPTVLKLCTTTSGNIKAARQKMARVELWRLNFRKVTSAEQRVF